MALQIGSGFIEIPLDWASLKAIVSSKNLSLQYVENSTAYNIFAVDEMVAYTTIIYTGTVPSGASVDQTTNDANETDFETNYQANANQPIRKGGFDDPRLIFKFGNKTTTSTSETLVSLRAYVPQSSEAQRSVKSSSTQDNPSGSGAAAVRITYLNSSYVRKTEDITLSGTSRIQTVATDIRFVEDFEVIDGAAAAGAISLLEAASGPQNEFVGIASGTTQAFLCHHYVPAGKKAYVLRWYAVSDDEANFKLYGQSRPDGTNLVERILDLENLTDRGLLTPAYPLQFDREHKGILVPEMSYIRATTVPQQSSSTVIRAGLVIWESDA